MISTHLSTFQPQKWDFAKHAQAQPKKERAYKKKKVYIKMIQYQVKLKIIVSQKSYDILFEAYHEN